MAHSMCWFHALAVPCTSAAAPQTRLADPLAADLEPFGHRFALLGKSYQRLTRPSMVFLSVCQCGDPTYLAGGDTGLRARAATLRLSCRCSPTCTADLQRGRGVVCPTALPAAAVPMLSGRACRAAPAGCATSGRHPATVVASTALLAGRLPCLSGVSAQALRLSTRSASTTAPRQMSPVGAGAAAQARHRMEIDPRWAAQSARSQRSSAGTVAREERRAAAPPARDGVNTVWSHDMDGGRADEPAGTGRALLVMVAVRMRGLHPSRAARRSSGCAQPEGGTRQWSTACRQR